MNYDVATFDLILIQLYPKYSHIHDNNDTAICNISIYFSQLLK